MPIGHAPLAQSAEHIHGKDGVAGSIPAGGSTQTSSSGRVHYPACSMLEEPRNAICQRFASGSLIVVVWTRSGVTILSGLR
jgi:hypothetical protein